MKRTLSIAGIEVDGAFSRPRTVVLDGDTLMRDGKPVVVQGVSRMESGSSIAPAGATITVDGTAVTVAASATAVSELSLVEPGTSLTLAHIASLDHGTGSYVLEQTSSLPAVNSPEEIILNYDTLLNPATAAYQSAGDWNGILLAVQGIAAVLWAIVLGAVRRRKPAYSLSLLIGAVGFVSVYFIQNQYLLFVSYSMMGCAWAAMLAMPFTILTMPFPEAT